MRLCHRLYGTRILNLELKGSFTLQLFLHCFDTTAKTVNYRFFIIVFAKLLEVTSCALPTPSGKTGVMLYLYVC